MTKARAARWCVGIGALGVGCLPTADATRPIALTSAWSDAPAPPVDALRLHRCDDTLGVTVVPNEDGPIEAPAGPWCGLDVVSRDPWVGEATISDGRAITFNLTLDDVAWRTDEAWTGAAWTLTFAEGADAVFAALTEPEWTVDASSDATLVAALRAVTLRATDADVDAAPLAVWPPAR